MKPLRPSMRRAIELARGKNNKLHRHHFGHWFGLKSTVKVRRSTVQALVDRGLAEYTDWDWATRTTAKPTEVTLTELAVSREGQV
jgi:hypothetical protein